MVSTATASTITETVRVHRRRYRWPAAQLNFWLFIMLVGSCVNLGIFAYFMTVQSQLQLPTPWYFPYWVTVGSLSVLFIWTILWLINQRNLLPGIVLLGSFILFVLWLVGLIAIAIQLWGPSGSVNSNCNLYVNDQAVSGVSVGTLAYLEQHSICQSWEAAWAFELVGVIFLIWMMIMSYQVHSTD
ncbi:MAG: hypothetical protein M1818_008393 [Claussenomyces sp. TS43310]|nr:MAG: hypothetical protein M1818_008393 [Claussenomyces sp. TS43310]